MLGRGAHGTVRCEDRVRRLMATVVAVATAVLLGVAPAIATLPSSQAAIDRPIAAEDPPGTGTPGLRTEPTGSLSGRTDGASMTEPSAAGVPSASVADAVVSPEDAAGTLEDRVSALAEEHVGATTPGATVAVVGPDEPLLMEAWGLADPTRGTPLTLESRAPVASISKVVTSLTALSLHHEDRLDLDAELATHLPVQDDRSQGTRRPVTGRHLLTHHAGLSEPLLLHPDPPDAYDTGPLRPALERHPPRIAGRTDAGLHYSPLQGHTLIGAAIEEANGTSFDEATAQHVLGPVGAHTAGFDGPGDEIGDAVLSTREGAGWTETSWPPYRERPAAALTWSTRDAASLLRALVADDDTLPAAVVEEATTTAVRPAHGGGGHTQVFFESWRADVRVLEHAGANGLAWFAVVPEARLGVFAAVTTEDPEAADFTAEVVDEVAEWAGAIDPAITEPPPEEGHRQITPPWATRLEPAAPVGTFQEQMYAARGPELFLRSVTGQVTVRRDGPDLLMGERRLEPTASRGRWCDPEGCIAGVRGADGTTVLLRGDQAMLQQTLVPARWWADARLLGAAAAAVVLSTVLALGGSTRSWWCRRRGGGSSTAVSRPLALAWSVSALGSLVLVPLLPLSLLTADSAAWIPAEGAAVWSLRMLTGINVVTGALWAISGIRRWSDLGRWRRVAVPLATVLGLAVTVVLVPWALPTV